MSSEHASGPPPAVGRSGRWHFEQVDFFWLSGMAGTGKSTITGAVARHFADDHRLGASFFFSRGSGDHGTARHFSSTIAVQVARSLPFARTYIYEAISEQPGIAQQAMCEQWSRLALEPLRMAGDHHLLSRSIIFVIDASNEFDNQEDVRDGWEVNCMSYDT